MYREIYNVDRWTSIRGEVETCIVPNHLVPMRSARVSDPCYKRGCLLRNSLTFVGYAIFKWEQNTHKYLLSCVHSQTKWWSFIARSPKFQSRIPIKNKRKFCLLLLAPTVIWTQDLSFMILILCHLSNYTFI